jgi:hypothetical protein
MPFCGGINLPLYSPDVQLLIGLDPSPKLLQMAGRMERRNLRVDFIEVRPRHFQWRKRASTRS